MIKKNERFLHHFFLAHNWPKNNLDKPNHTFPTKKISNQNFKFKKKRIQNSNMFRTKSDVDRYASKILNQSKTIQKVIIIYN